MVNKLYICRVMTGTSMISNGLLCREHYIKLGKTKFKINKWQFFMRQASIHKACCYSGSAYGPREAGQVLEKALGITK